MYWKSHTVEGRMGGYCKVICRTVASLIRAGEEAGAGTGTAKIFQLPTLCRAPISAHRLYTVELSKSFKYFTM